MKIDPDRLRKLRQQKGLSRSLLAERSGISERTIQRLENEPQKTQKTQEHTLNNLAKALGVEPGVLTGELPLPESNNIPADNPDRVQIGAQIAPKTRLAYDLIKRRYGVNATEIINMAPFFFALLAEGSLAWRRKKLKEAEEAFSRLWQIEGFWQGGLSGAESFMGEGVAAEEESITKADLFGEYLDDDFMGTPFDSTKNNPFTYYLRKLADELAISGVVNVDGGDLNMASNFKFPHYDICRDELDRIANGSHDAKRALETGHARLSEITEELMAEDACEERAKWLEDKLPVIYKALGKAGDMLADRVATTSDENRKLVENANSQWINSETKKGGDDQ